MVRRAGMGSGTFLPISDVDVYNLEWRAGVGNPHLRNCPGHETNRPKSMSPPSTSPILPRTSIEPINRVQTDVERAEYRVLIPSAGFMETTGRHSRGLKSAPYFASARPCPRRSDIPEMEFRVSAHSLPAGGISVISYQQCRRPHMVPLQYHPRWARLRGPVER
jgi:hypothetical protein